MSLAAGTRVGAYEIVSLLGAGGMGEVYRARDTKLERQVAIKILPDAFAADPERVARFEREARTLAALNHPHIAQIYGVESAAQSPALVMELVDGPTLAEQIALGPLPLDEVLSIARQICDALEAAHAVGIIHRDLKPANVKLRSDGTVKVLDFGLAKALTPDGGLATPDMSQSPTALSPAATYGGVLLGTAPYMAPEQARGKRVDKRADIWAFGAVLYEMLTGRRAFEGEDLSLTLASVMKSDPAWDALPHDVPPRLHTVLRRCLQKDPNYRFRDIGDVRLALEGAFDAPSTAASITASPYATMSRTRRMMPWAVAILLSVATGLTVWWATRTDRTPPIVRFELALPDLSRLNGPNFTLSPDGRTLVYVERNASGQGRLMRRDMQALRAEPIAGTDGAETSPFFSPDGAWIGFVADRDRALRRVPASGGAAATIAQTEAFIFTPTWMADDTIVFGSPTGLWRVSANGGVPLQVAKTDRDTGGPHGLPDGRGVLFHVNPAGAEEGAIEVLLPSGERRRLVDGMNPFYIPTGHLVFARVGGSLWAMPFDADTLTVAGEAVPLPESPYRRGRVNPSELAFAANGTLVYLPSVSSTGRLLMWVDRTGMGRVAFPMGGAYAFPRLAPDGRRVALVDAGEVWVFDLERMTRTRLSYGNRANVATASTWSPDGRRVTFTEPKFDRTTPIGTKILWRPADASAQADVLLDWDRLVGAGSWSPDATAYVITTIRSEPGGTAVPGNQDLHVLHPGRNPPDSTFLATEFSERAPAFSPSGRWIAYVSNDSGRDEVYVRPYPGSGDRLTISNNGGAQPVWSRNRRELFYRVGNAMMSVTVDESATALSLGPPVRLFDSSAYTSTTNPTANYDVAPNGEAFLMVQAPSGPGTSAVVVLNWHEELKRLVPTK